MISVSPDFSSHLRRSRPVKRGILPQLLLQTSMLVNHNKFVIEGERRFHKECCDKQQKQYFPKDKKSVFFTMEWCFLSLYFLVLKRIFVCNWLPFRGVLVLPFVWCGDSNYISLGSKKGRSQWMIKSNHLHNL